MAIISASFLHIRDLDERVKGGKIGGEAGKSLIPQAFYTKRRIKVTKKSKILENTKK